MGRKWYVVNTYSGYEDKVRENILRRTDSMGMSDRIFHVEVPEEMVVEIKDGKRVEKPRKVFPGYVLVEMEEFNIKEARSNDAWHVVRNTPGVTSFVGTHTKEGDRPTPLSDREVRKIFKRAATKAKIQIDLHVGEHVKGIGGPFADFSGDIIEINPEKGKLKVSVSIFGRATPVELEFAQVQKV